MANQFKLLKNDEYHMHTLRIEITECITCNKIAGNVLIKGDIALKLKDIIELHHNEN